MSNPYILDIHVYSGYVHAHTHTHTHTHTRDPPGENASSVLDDVHVIFKSCLSI